MVSVIIPVYNREEVIVRSVLSVLDQTYTNFEIIVVDDCSTDKTGKMVKSIGSEKVFYYRLDKNSGACAARNKGLELARGELIAFQDSDDEWRRDKLERQIEALENSNADIVFCAFEKTFSDGTRKKIPYDLEQRFYIQRELIYESVVSTQTILGKAGAIRSIGFDNTMPCMQDYDFIIRASGLYSVYYLNEILVNVYEQSDSITASKKQYRKRLDISNMLLNKYSHLAQDYPEWNIKMLKTIAHAQIMLGENAQDRLNEIYNKDKTAINLIKCLLNKIGLLRIIMEKLET